MGSVARTGIVVRPRLRGVFHEWAFFAALAAGAMLDRDRGRRARDLFLLGLRRRARSDVRRQRALPPLPVEEHGAAPLGAAPRPLDDLRLHRGTYTPFALLAFDGRTQWLVLVMVWSGAALGLLLELVWIDSPRWLTAVAYLAVGWVGVLALPQMFSGVGVAGAVLLLVGGGLYTVGAAIYAAEWPNPFPRTLGFHEIFHLLVVAAAATQFVAVSLVVT